MNGGGGGGSESQWPSDIKLDELLRQATANERVASYETELNTFFQDLLTNFNKRDTEQINKHIESIKSALMKDIEGSISLIYGGSVSKHTYVDGLSDIDMLAILNESGLTGNTPNDVLKYFAEKLKQHFPNTEIKVGNLAVTIRFASTEHEIQILPAIRTASGIRIANVDGNVWSNVIKPDVFASRLTKVNEQNNSKVVPVIKLFKALNMLLPKAVRLSGYHIESIAINAFENYEGEKNYKDMLLYLSEQAKDKVMSPMKDETGQSVHVDDYLGTEGSLERKIASTALERIVSRIKLANTEASIERWEDMMGG